MPTLFYRPWLSGSRFRMVLDFRLCTFRWNAFNSFRSFQNIVHSCRERTDCGFSMVADVVWLLKKVQIENHAGISLGSFLCQAIALRGSWMSETCVWGCLCAPPDQWQRNFFVSPPSDADFRKRLQTILITASLGLTSLTWPRLSDFISLSCNMAPSSYYASTSTIFLVELKLWIKNQLL